MTKIQGCRFQQSRTGKFLTRLVYKGKFLCGRKDGDSFYEGYTRGYFFQYVCYDVWGLEILFSRHQGGINRVFSDGNFAVIWIIFHRSVTPLIGRHALSELGEDFPTWQNLWCQSESDHWENCRGRKIIWKRYIFRRGEYWKSAEVRMCWILVQMQSEWYSPSCEAMALVVEYPKCGISSWQADCRGGRIKPSWRTGCGRSKSSGVWTSVTRSLKMYGMKDWSRKRCATRIYNARILTMEEKRPVLKVIRFGRFSA